MPAEQLTQIFNVLEGGAEVATENVIQFPVDAAGAAAETALAGEGTSTLVQLGNGAAAEVSQLTVVEGGAATATTSGLGILAMDVGAVGAAVAPALGLVAGVGLYNLAPEFWTSVSERLVSAGQTIGGKVRTFLNGDSRQLGLSQDTIEIFKNALIEYGVFNSTVEPAKDPSTSLRGFTIDASSYTLTDALSAIYGMIDDCFNLGYGVDTIGLLKPHIPSFIEYVLSKYSVTDLVSFTVSVGTVETYDLASVTLIPLSSAYYGGNEFNYNSTTKIFSNFRTAEPLSYSTASVGPQLKYAPETGVVTIDSHRTYQYIGGTLNDTWHIIRQVPESILITQILGFNKIVRSENVQEGATLPDSNPFPQTYPEWLPWSPPAGVPYPSNLPDIFPIEVPDLNPDISQSEAQNPDPNPDPAPWLQFILDNAVVPEAIIEPEPTPVPEPDPDPQPEPEPLPDPAEEEVDPDPPNPNPNPPTPPLPIIPVLPDVVPSNAMFTVYRPSLSQLNSFGGWLWDSNIIEQILRMWQNPLDGIIAFMKVYAEPTVGAASNIQVGYLDSGVAAPVVTSQFTTVDCGSVDINESRYNATDYTPYTSLHLYLPFIGIVELDSDEFMNGTISILYHIDVYTGTCLAEVKCTRAADMPNATIIYTFSGNASQQLPLTSASFAGALSSLVSAVGGGIAIASGGGLAAIAGGLTVGHSLTHEMIHIGHSGALSANAGIMAARKPYVIISRKHGYDANAYNELYGYPTNKTVFLGNCSGFTRVKAGRLQSKASEKEKDEIMSLLKEGVIL